METMLKKYEKELQDADFEVVHTPRLGWILIRTDYQHYSYPVIPIHSPAELVEYIESQR